MFIVWSRWGILALLFVVAAVALGPLVITPVLFGENATPGQFSIGMGIGALLVAAVMWLVVWLTVGKVIDKPTPLKNLVALSDDQGNYVRHEAVEVRDASGAPIIQQPRSTLFWIPVTIWPYVIAGFGVVAIVLSFF